MSLFCLVHGSTQNASGWAMLVPELQRRGHRAICVNLPIDEPEASGTRYAQMIAEAMRNSTEAPIVVAHSVSGVLLPLLPTYGAVSRIVFLAAFVPQTLKQFTGAECNYRYKALATIDVRLVQSYCVSLHNRFRSQTSLPEPCQAWMVRTHIALKLLRSATVMLSSALFNTSRAAR